MFDCLCCVSFHSGSIVLFVVICQCCISFNCGFLHPRTNHPNIRLRMDDFKKGRRGGGQGLGLWASAWSLGLGLLPRPCQREAPESRLCHAELESNRGNSSYSPHFSLTRSHPAPPPQPTNQPPHARCAHSDQGPQRRDYKGREGGLGEGPPAWVHSHDVKAASNHGSPEGSKRKQGRVMR